MSGASLQDWKVPRLPEQKQFENSILTVNRIDIIRDSFLVFLEVIAHFDRMRLALDRLL